MNAEHLTPIQIRQNYDAEVARWLPNSHTNHELCQTLSKLDSEHARQIYACCRNSPGYLEHYIRSERVVSRLLPAVLGAFSSKCAICGWDTGARAEIFDTLKCAKRSSDMFPMPELEEWYRAAEAAAVTCPKIHSTMAIWKLLRMLKVKVVTPKPATIDTDYYN